jgi:CHC2 zinc finger
MVDQKEGSKDNEVLAELDLDLRLTREVRAVRARQQFERAPPAVQAAFFTELGVELERERERGRSLFERHGVWPTGWRPKTRWGQRWRDRAYLHRLAEDRGLPQSSFPLERDRLLAIPPPEYVTRLTDEEPRARKICCPLPTHDERTPSFHVHDEAERGWRCFGCQASGDIYTLAGMLWGLDRKGDDFKEIHRRLLEVFG